VAPEMLAAIITGGLSLVLAVYNLWGAMQQDRRVVALEQLRSELAREASAEKAKLDYEYEARRRLYDRFEPALFQLLEQALYALDRIKNLTNPEVWAGLSGAVSQGVGATVPRAPGNQSCERLPGTAPHASPPKPRPARCRVADLESVRVTTRGSCGSSPTLRVHFHLRRAAYEGTSRWSRC